MTRAIAVATTVLAAVPAHAMAQTDLGANHEGGLYWHVAAPGGATWTLVCRFRPATIRVNQYDTHRWINRLNTRGRGPQAGRRPVNNGDCTVTKTGGAGPVGIAIVRGADVVADGAASVGERAAVGVF
ncbi:hypothetical protein HZ989_05045 [Brevundimonas sp. AJA228-03]|uniref:hypothetical protein n=1 Tax=Brevundimonas sp. AJA228-03 TaxID=2752515 RepID=UPI001AE01E81|nr:hypothetical protein [Brevundimonas sp. AJA228-03]QTN20432.1 hypothetical protein HZ989_05045 [Brevundimonas sp. AJA228-03]